MDVKRLNCNLPSLAKVSKHHKRKIVVFDLETIGLLTPDKKLGIVEFGAVVIVPDGRIYLTSALINPEMPIPAKASNIHGIDDEAVSGAPRLVDMSDRFSNIFSSSILSGFNSELFDYPYLTGCFKQSLITLKAEPFAHVDVRKIWCRQQKTKHGKLAVVCQHYGVQITDAHRAYGDALATAQILEQMVTEHGNDVLPAKICI